MSQKSADGRWAMLVLVILVVTWGVLGWNDLPHQARAGFETDGFGVVTRVDPGSPAEAAGLASGDQITYMDGVAVENAAAIARQTRKNVGEILHLTVNNDNSNYKLMRIKYAQMPARELSRERISVMVGFCFLLFPLAAFFSKAVEATRVLTVMGVGLSLAFLPGPHIEDFGTRALTTATNSLFVFVGVAAMLQFLLVFPHRRPWLGRARGKMLLFLPALLLWVLIAYRVLFTPTVSEILNTVTRTASAAVIGIYLLIALFQFLRNFSRTDKAQRKALKINGMLLGTILGIVPVTIAQLVSTFSPESGLPGQDFYFVTLALIPMTWARSASRSLA